jgi:hypothetical protein
VNFAAKQFPRLCRQGRGKNLSGRQIAAFCSNLMRESRELTRIHWSKTFFCLRKACGVTVAKKLKKRRFPRKSRFYAL